jgi:hypothetical protein
MQHSKVAENVISKCGGPKVVANWLGIDLTTVYRWRYAADRGGTGGLIPADRQQELLKIARAHGVNLRPVDFFDEVPPTAPKSARRH